MFYITIAAEITSRFPRRSDISSETSKLSRVYQDNKKSSSGEEHHRQKENMNKGSEAKENMFHS